MAMETWRLFFNPEGDAADVVSYGSALAEGRIVGKYQLSSEQLSDSVVIQGVRKKSIVAGADVSVDREAAEDQDIDVAGAPRQGRRGAKPVGSVNLSELMAQSSAKFDAVERDLDEPAVLLYTSGTTGKPKGVKLTHRNFFSQCHDVAAELVPMTADDRIVGVLPLYHVYGLANGLVSSVFFGCSFGLVPQYTPTALLDTIRNIRATILIAIPSMYMHLLQLAYARKTEMPRTLRISVSGGAPLAHKTLADFERVFDTRIFEGYGLTETTSAVSMNRSGEEFKPGSIGPPSSGVEMRVVDEEDNEVPDESEGEIVIRGQVVTPGYWNLPDETAQTIRNGWLHTGDLGHRDRDGYFFITDRKKDLIIRGGFNISPREVEEVLFEHPQVEDAAVVGVPDKRGDEVVKAFIVAKNGTELTESELTEYCTRNLADYKVPRRIEFRSSLPKSQTGKVLRKELRSGGGRDEREITREV